MREVHMYVLSTVPIGKRTYYVWVSIIIIVIIIIYLRLVLEEHTFIALPPINPAHVCNLKDASLSSLMIFGLQQFSLHAVA